MPTSVTFPFMNTTPGSTTSQNKGVSVAVDIKMVVHQLSHRLQLSVTCQQTTQFCSHEGGTNCLWSQVHRHLASCLQQYVESAFAESLANNLAERYKKIYVSAQLLTAILKNVTVTDWQKKLTKTYTWCTCVKKTFMIYKMQIKIDNNLCTTLHHTLYTGNRQSTHHNIIHWI